MQTGVIDHLDDELVAVFSLIVLVRQAQSIAGMVEISDRRREIENES